ncbi:hypothetical protein KC349_g2998 [Hortaea werneckii]|nr:hypothetical protein KC349_g2998 [Hortaea werneckii]
MALDLKTIGTDDVSDTVTITFKCEDDLQQAIHAITAHPASVWKCRLDLAHQPTIISPAKMAGVSPTGPTMQVEGPGVSNSFQQHDTTKGVWSGGSKQGFRAFERTMDGVFGFEMTRISREVGHVHNGGEVIAFYGISPAGEDEYIVSWDSFWIPAQEALRKYRPSLEQRYAGMNTPQMIKVYVAQFRQQRAIRTSPHLLAANASRATSAGDREGSTLFNDERMPRHRAASEVFSLGSDGSSPSLSSGLHDTSEFDVLAIIDTRNLGNCAEYRVLWADSWADTPRPGGGQAIKAKTLANGHTHYLIRWRATWEPYDHIIPGCEEALQDFRDLQRHQLRYSQLASNNDDNEGISSIAARAASEYGTVSASVDSPPYQPSSASLFRDPIDELDPRPLDATNRLSETLSGWEQGSKGAETRPTGTGLGFVASPDADRQGTAAAGHLAHLIGDENPEPSTPWFDDILLVGSDYVQEQLSAPQQMSVARDMPALFSNDDAGERVATGADGDTMDQVYRESARDDNVDAGADAHASNGDSILPDGDGTVRAQSRRLEAYNPLSDMYPGEIEKATGTKRQHEVEELDLGNKRQRLE